MSLGTYLARCQWPEITTLSQRQAPFRHLDQREIPLNAIGGSEAKSAFHAVGEGLVDRDGLRCARHALR